MPVFPQRARPEDEEPELSEDDDYVPYVTVKERKSQMVYCFLGSYLEI